MSTIAANPIAEETHSAKPKHGRIDSRSGCTQKQRGKTCPVVKSIPWTKQKNMHIFLSNQKKIRKNKSTNQFALKDTTLLKAPLRRFPPVGMPNTLHLSP